VSNHPPLVATTGLPFIVAECASLDALARSRGAPAAFEELCVLDAVPPKVLLYTHTGTEEGEGAGGVVHQIRARMHRANGTEDAGTGAANACLAGVLASLAPPPGCSAALVRARVVQGVEMGRPSELRAEAERLADGVGAVRIGGCCVAMSRGELLMGLHRMDRSR
jgi:trans-2,3-dihydro-3-hydroxyanthranilate isomerase